MKETKSNILKAALKLFNSNGFVNVRLQHIADEAFVSVGNLAYHYQNKQEILQALYKAILSRQTELLKELTVVPLFEHLDYHWSNLFDLQLDYRFFYIDTLEVLRSNTEIAQKHRQHMEWEINQYVQVLRFNISRGAFKSSYDDHTIHQMAHNLWMISNLWLHQNSLQYETSDPEIDEFKARLWCNVLGWMTDLGLKEYQQFMELNKRNGI
ncbi:MAG: TetR/AcrR family transcriptional regulator [Bacteroidota bacterium]